mgnify:CR=1 FL=1
MANYSLAANEGIIIQYDGVYHNRKRSEIVLTNQNLICVEANNGMFKTTYNVLKFPVNQIKVVNGQAQISVIKDGGDWTLQVLLKNGTEQFKFSGELLLTGKSAENITDTTLIGGVKSVLGTIGINVKSKKAENITSKCIGCMAPLSGEHGQTVRCKYCDTEQTL